MTFKLLDRLHYKQEKEVSRNESEASVKIKEKKGGRKSMKEKMRKVRYPMLIVWGIFMGAAGTAGVKSSWHVIPGWLIGVIVILGIMVMLTWMISGKNDKSIKTPEKETEKLTSKYNSEISVISKAVEEPVELEFWGKRNGIDQFRVKSIAGRNIVSDHVLLISFDGSEARDVALDAVVTGKEHSEYLERLKCFIVRDNRDIMGRRNLKRKKLIK